MAGFGADGFSDGFFFESIFDGSADSLDTEAVRVAFGFAVGAGEGAESVEARMGGSGAIDALSGLAICGAAVGAAGFGASAAGGAESVEARADAVAIGALSGLTVCGAGDGAAVFGVSAGSGAEAVEAGMGGAVAIGVPSSLIACEGARMAGVLGGTAVNAGAADSIREAARFGASSAFPPAANEPLFAGAGLAAGSVSEAPACRGAVCRPPWISERESLEGVRRRSFCGLTRPSVAGMEDSRSGPSAGLYVRAKLAPTTATPASPIAPAVSVQRCERGLTDF